MQSRMVVYQKHKKLPLIQCSFIAMSFNLLNLLDLSFQSFLQTPLELDPTMNILPHGENNSRLFIICGPSPHFWSHPVLGSWQLKAEAGSYFQAVSINLFSIWSAEHWHCCRLLKLKDGFWLDIVHLWSQFLTKSFCLCWSQPAWAVICPHSPSLCLGENQKTHCHIGAQLTTKPQTEGPAIWPLQSHRPWPVVYPRKQPDVRCQIKGP